MKNYIDLYVERGIEKIRRQGRNILHLRKNIIKYLRNLANEMMKRKSVSLLIPEEFIEGTIEKKLLDRSDPNVEDLFGCSPVQIVEGNIIEFCSIELLEYFQGLSIIHEMSKMHQPVVNHKEKQNLGIVIDIDASGANVNSILIFKSKPDLQIKTIKNLKENMPDSYLKTVIEIILGMNYVKTDIGDQEHIQVIGMDQTAICFLNKEIVCANKNGSILMKNIEIRKPCNDITRSLIPSSMGNFLLGFSDKKIITLYCLSDMFEIKEKIISENVDWLASTTFSDDGSKLVVAIQNSKGNTIIIYNLKNFNSRPVEILENKYEIQSIYLSPGIGNYMLVIKEHLNFDYYIDDKLKWSKEFYSKEIDFNLKIIQKVKAFAKSNTSITTTQRMFQKLEYIEKDCLVQDLNTDDKTREVYVNLQAAIEQLFKYYIQRNEIINCFGCIHTEFPATPLCADPLSAAAANSLIISEKRENIKQVLIVEARAKIIRSLLQCPQVEFYSVYPKKNYMKRNEDQRKIYQENLGMFKNLHDCGLNTEEIKFSDSMNGGSYLLEHKSGSWYLFSLQGKQANSSDMNCVWRIWFGRVDHPSISDRLESLSYYFKELGFSEFSRQLKNIKRR